MNKKIPSKKAMHVVKIGKFLGEATVRYTAQHAGMKWAFPKNINEDTWLCEELMKVGPAYVKIGQLISTRSDIFPKKLTSRLSKLQDKAPLMTQNEIYCVMREEGVIDMFEWFDTSPLASASIGQVHRARVKGFEEEVVVKIQRPNLKEEFQDTYELLEMGIGALGYIVKDKKTQDIVQVLRDTMDSLFREIDFIMEAKNIQYFRKLFRNNRDIIIPRVDISRSTSRILIMEYVPGIKISNIDAINELKIDKKKLAKKLMGFFVRGIMTFGVFHSDPHPGNVAINKQGKLILYDYGMVTSFPNEIVSKFKKSIYLLYIEDIDSLVNLLVQSEIIKIRGDPNVKELNEYQYTSLYRLLIIFSNYAKTLDVKDLRENMISNTLLNSDKNEFYFDSTMMMLFRTMTILEGNCKELDPEFNYMDIIDVDIVTDFAMDVDFMKTRAEEDVNTIFENIRMNSGMNESLTRNAIAKSNVARAEQKMEMKNELDKIKNDQVLFFMIISFLLIFFQ
jgi:predicted unusual protein kinase regulating ubiquinone biosynthesis (AarF/ABC1/UbiB family)